jgi:flavin-dependent dehydrogenase
MKACGASTEEWWAHALEKSRIVRRSLHQAEAVLLDLGVYAAFPSRLSNVVGNGWIAVGDAAVAYDPISGRGVATAVDMAFRAFEAAMIDPSWIRMGADYEEAVVDGFERHLQGRARVYGEASEIFAESFLASIRKNANPREDTAVAGVQTAP